MMNKELEIYIKNLAIEKLMESNIGDKLQQAMNAFEKVQKYMSALSEKEGEEGATTVKAATVITLSILKKFVGGKMPADLNADDWKEIIKDVSENVVLKDDRAYTKFVFSMYEKYIRFSANQIQGVASEKTINTIIELADELACKSEQFENEELKEVDYIEECLWICLDAMMKLIAATAERFVDKDYAEFAQALATYAFEYGRFVLYRREQEIINELIQRQYELDEALERKYEAFLKDMEQQAEYFYVLIENAFVPNFRDAFLHSIILAQTAGVKESEVLKDMDDIDTFFLD